MQTETEKILASEFYNAGDEELMKERELQLGLNTHATVFEIMRRLTK